MNKILGRVVARIERVLELPKEDYVRKMEILKETLEIIKEKTEEQCK